MEYLGEDILNIGLSGFVLINKSLDIEFISYSILHFLKVSGISRDTFEKTIIKLIDKYSSGDNKKTKSFNVKINLRNLDLVFDVFLKSIDNHYYVVFLKDITKINEKENSLKKIKNILLSVINSSPIMIFIIDESGRILIWNPKLEEFTGVKAKDILGKRLIDIVPEFGVFLDDVEDIISGKRIFSEKEYRVINYEGEIRDVFSRIYLLPQVKSAVFFGEDITNKKRIEKSMIQAQKMETVGTLASGIAHDFNNILALIKGNFDVLKSKIPGEFLDSFSKSFHNIEKGIESGKELAKKLLMFGRQEEKILHPVDLVKVIEEVSKLVKPSLKSGIKLYQYLTEHSVYIKAEETMLEQVLLNLIINANDAVDESGEIRIYLTLEETIENERISTYANIIVEDNGEGMIPEIKERIFEPFFTTKGEKGSGLGLSIVYNTVKNLSGDIWVESEHQKGTRFTIRFPAIQVFGDRKGEEIKENLSAKILFVDDERDIVDVTRTFFEENGYEFIGATNGREAFNLFLKEKPDIVVTDYFMPSMNGKELIEKIKKEEPTAKVIIISAFVGNFEVEEIVSKYKLTFIQKPYSLKFLKEKIEEILTNVSS